MTESQADFDARMMDEALRWAAKAADSGDVPVAALVVLDGRIIGRGFNVREAAHDPSGHAEVVALREACQRVARWRLDGATLYVTLEPCAMCAGAIVNARIKRLVYGATDAKAGAVRSLYRICDDPRLNHRVEICAGIQAEACAALLTGFFAEARRRRAATGSRRPRPRLRGFVEGFNRTPSGPRDATPQAQVHGPTGDAPIEAPTNPSPQKKRST